MGGQRKRSRSPERSLWGFVLTLSLVLVDALPDVLIVQKFEQHVKRAITVLRKSKRYYDVDFERSHQGLKRSQCNIKLKRPVQIARENYDEPPAPLRAASRSIEREIRLCKDHIFEAVGKDLGGSRGILDELIRVMGKYNRCIAGKTIRIWKNNP